MSTTPHPVRPWYVCSGNPCTCSKTKPAAPALSPHEARVVARFDAADPAPESFDAVADELREAIIGKLGGRLNALGDDLEAVGTTTEIADAILGLPVVQRLLDPS